MYGEIKNSTGLREKTRELGTSRGGECRGDMHKKVDRDAKREEGKKAGGEPQHWGGIEIQREERPKSSSERHAEKQQRTKERKRSERDCVTAALHSSR